MSSLDPDPTQPGPPGDARVRAGQRSAIASPESRVVFAVDVMFPSQALVQHLREFQAAFPHVELEVRTEPVGGVAQLLLDGGADLGVGIGSIPAQLRGHPSLIVPSAPVVGATHPLAQIPGALAPEQLQEHVQIVLTDRSGATGDAQRGILSARSWRVAEHETKRALLIAGFGWGTMPLHLIGDDLEAGRLVRLSLAGYPPQAGLRLTAMVRRDGPAGPVGGWLLEQLCPELSPSLTGSDRR